MALSRIVIPKRLAAENTVVTTSLLTTAIEDERKWYEEDKREREPDRGTSKFKWDAVDVCEALDKLRTTDTLILSYSRIKSIENLSVMRALTKLRLDNNDIEVIQGLDELVNLTELDLSFNNIVRIDGLSALKKLTDLSLYSNKLTTIENLDAQINSLESLSIGRNELTDLRSLVYLRRFPSLRSLCYEGNIRGRAAAEYRGSAIALLPQLRYLDWTLITDTERKAALETHHRLLTELTDGAQHSTGVVDPVHAALSHSAVSEPAPSSNDAGNAAAVKEAGLQFVAYIWRIMMDPKSVSDIPGLGSIVNAAAARKAEGKDDEGDAPPSSEHDNDTALRIPGIPERLELLHEAINAFVEQAVMKGLATHADLCREVSAADYVLQSYLDASDYQAVKLLENYARARKHLLRSSESLQEAAKEDNRGSSLISPGSRPGVTSPLASPSPSHRNRGGFDDDAASENSEVAAIHATLAGLSELKAHNEELHGKLTGIETVLHEQRLMVLTEFDAAYSEIASRRNELFQKVFRALEKEALLTAEECKTIALSAVDNHQEHLAAATAVVATQGVSPDAESSRAMRDGGEEMDDYNSGEHKHSQRSVDDDVAAILADKEVTINTVTAAFDQRIARVLASEDKTRMNERDRERMFVKARIAAESERHRLRMGEVDAVAARNAADIEAMIAMEEQNLAELVGEA